MNGNIFIPGEGYCEYNQDQIKFMRDRIFKNLADEGKEKNIDKISVTRLNAEMIDERDYEQEGEYILGLA